MTNKKQYFQSHDLTFVSTVMILSNTASIEAVVFHPTKENVKVFSLSPKTEVEKLHKQYINDRLLVPPQRLSAKIATIRHLRAEIGNRDAIKNSSFG